jgi:hypothetical protein
VRLGRSFLEILEWLPILATPFAVFALSDGLTKTLGLEVWLILGLAVAVNLGWIGLMKWNRRMVEFRARFPGFRVKK